jgi:ketosteroid isomerase-like protein
MAAAVRVAQRPQLEGWSDDMHTSRLAGFIIDCNVPDLAAAAKFWGAALRMDLKSLPAEEGEKYVRLVDPQRRLHIEVQAVTHPSRVHLDIESDDVEAEAARLEGLGAKRVAQVHTWWVMEAPTGQRFCVVRRSSRPSALERWHRIIESRDITRLDDLLADDVVFESPAVHTPQQGKALTHKYLAAACVVLNNGSFQYVGEWHGEQSAVLEFKCQLGEVAVNGIDMIEWNAEGLITRFKVMVRPVKALQTLMPLMAAELAKG